jgi:hypothetical protein
MREQRVAVLLYDPVHATPAGQYTAEPVAEKALDRMSSQPASSAAASIRSKDSLPAQLDLTFSSSSGLFSLVAGISCPESGLERPDRVGVWQRHRAQSPAGHVRERHALSVVPAAEVTAQRRRVRSAGAP